MEMGTDGDIKREEYGVEWVKDALLVACITGWLIQKDMSGGTILWLVGAQFAFN